MGQLYLIPTTLGGQTIEDIIPEGVRQIATELRHFIVEDIKSARRYLRKLDREFPIDDSQFFILNKKTDIAQVRSFLKPLKEGHSMGIISEAGCPGIADPGATAVSFAHELGIQVVPLVGPSSILLALMGSGFSGQNFTFNGYLPKDRKDRIQELKRMESDVFRTGNTHLFMDTPFRNMNVLEDLLNELNDNTEILIASNITLPNASVKTRTAKEWREEAYDLSKIPTIFGIGKLQI